MVRAHRCSQERAGRRRGSPGSSSWGGDSSMERDLDPGVARRALGRLLEAVLANRGEANAVFDILAVLQVGTRGVRRGSRPGSRGWRPEWYLVRLGQCRAGAGMQGDICRTAYGILPGAPPILQVSQMGGSGGRCGRGRVGGSLPGQGSARPCRGGLWV